jgi:hypothetical protein
MPRVAPIVTSFNAGEWSPQLYGRVDLQKYANAARIMENFVPLPQGTATRRPGTRFVAETKSSGDGIVIPFEFSTTQAYIIEAGNLYFRFYKDRGRIETTPGVAYEIATPYTLADLELLQWVQSADTLYLAHPSYAPRKLTRTGHTSWSLTAITFTLTPTEWTGANWPGTVAFHQQRLFWGGTPGQPQTIWGSKTNDFENLTTGSGASDALKFTIADGKVNAIQWMASAKSLLVGTAGAEFSIRASTLGEALTPDNITASPETTVGCAKILPIRVGQSTLFAQRARRKIFEMSYNFESDAQVSPEVSLFARHITRPKIRSLAYQAEPWSIVWGARDDGVLVGCTYMRDQQVIGWHRHPIGGADAKVRSVAVIPGDGQDELWLLVERTIGGATKRYVEFMEYEFWAASNTDTKDCFFVDSGLTYSGVATAAITGLAHLEGQTVQVLANGAAHPDVVVSSGSITLNRAVTKAQVGLKCTARLETMSLEAGSANGTAQTKTTRVVEVGVRFWNTLGAKVGYDETVVGGMEEVLFRDPSMPMDAAPLLFTGDKTVKFPATWDRDGAIVRVVQDQPLPCTISAMVPLTITNDG